MKSFGCESFADWDFIPILYCEGIGVMGFRYGERGVGKLVVRFCVVIGVWTGYKSSPYKCYLLLTLLPSEYRELFSMTLYI